MKRIAIALVLLCVPFPAFAQQGFLPVHGNGAPTAQTFVPDCTKYRLYNDDLTGTVWAASRNAGYPCGWAVVSGSGGGASLPTNALTYGLSSTTSRPATYGDVISLFSTCSGTQYPGVDGFCHTPVTLSSLIGNNEGDSVNCGWGTAIGPTEAGSSTLWYSHIVLSALGVPAANITDNCTPGSGIMYIANKHFNNVTVTNNMYTIADALQNNGQQSLSDADFQSIYRAMLAWAVDLTVAGQASDASGYPSKINGASSAITWTAGTVSSSTNYPGIGETCSSGPCTAQIPNVTGPDIFIVLEQDYGSTYSGITECVDGTSGNSCIKGTSTQVGINMAFQETTSGLTAANAPWADHITMPGTPYTGSTGSANLRHTVYVTIPTGETLIRVIGTDGDQTSAGPFFGMSGLYRWYNANFTSVQYGNQIFRLVAAEVKAARLQIGFSDPSSYIDGYLSPTITWTGFTNNPDVSVTVTNGVPGTTPTINYIGSGCTGTPTGTLNGGGSGAVISATCSGGGLATLSISGGTNYGNVQQFNMWNSHPNGPGNAAIAAAAIKNFSQLITGRDTDAGAGTIPQWCEKDAVVIPVSTGTAYLYPYCKLNFIPFSTATQLYLDPGRPGMEFNVQLYNASAGALTVTLPNNIYGPTSTSITAGATSSFHFYKQTNGIGPYWSVTEQSPEVPSFTVFANPSGSTAGAKWTGAPVLTSVQVTGFIKNGATQSTVNCSTSGSVVFSQAEQGTSRKLVTIYENACVGTASYTYPTAFSFAPQVISQSLASTISATATTVTVTGTTSTGFATLDGY